MVTVAVRRIDFDSPGEDITSFLPDDVLLLPNTSGAATAEEALRIARLARAGGLPDWIKLEVIPDPRYLLPDPVDTLRAAELLVADGFTVLPYVMPDPALRETARGSRLRDRDAPRGTDRLRTGPQAPRGDPDHDRAGDRAGRRRRGPRRAVARAPRRWSSEPTPCS